MGYIILTAQLNKIKQLTENVRNLDSTELLWLPGGIQITIWTTTGGVPDVYLINEDGGIVGNN